MEPTREIYWNIIGGKLIYLLALAALAFMVRGILGRVRLWRIGRKEERTDRPAERLWGLLVEVFGHRRQLRDPYPGLMHLFIFYGFFVELIATTLVAVQEWSGVHFLQGGFYRWFSLLSDGFGLVAIAGIGMALWRRAVLRPERINSVLDDWVALWLLLLIFVQGFVVEGLRIAATELAAHPDWAPWSPGGYLVALLVQGLATKTLQTLHRLNWWFHAATAFFFIGYMGYGKFNHIWYGLLNIYTRNLGPTGRLSYPDIEAAMETDPDSIETLGVEKIGQYPWKGLLDLDA
ncbi:MAG: hypothetical protein ACE5IM_11705, partial [Nitrospinota bacterium]